MKVDIPNSVLTYEVKDNWGSSRVRWEVTIRCGNVRLAEFEFVEDEPYEEFGYTIQDEEDAVEAALTSFGVRLKEVLGL